MKLAAIPPFTFQDWWIEHLAGLVGMEVLRCPNCGRPENYALLAVPRDDGSERRYRACKTCGCWQEADGTAAYRCSLLIHSCVQPIPDGVTCKNCDQGGPRQTHRCHRILPPQEIGVTTCRQCGTTQTPAHVVGWPVKAD